MIKELMFITTILYGNALPTFNNDIERVLRPISSTSNNVSLGSVTFVVNDAVQGLNNETLSFNATNLDYGFLYEDNYNLYYKYNIRVSNNVGSNTILCNNYIKLNYDDYKYLIDNAIGVDFDIDIGTIEVINTKNTLRIIYGTKLSLYTPSGENFTYYDLYGTHTQTMTLRNENGPYTNFSISNINVVNFTGYHDRIYLKDYYDKVFDTGYDSGYDSGYDTGYNAGTLDFDLISWIPNAVGGFLNFEIFPNFTLSNVLLAIVGAFLAIWILRVFVGG